MSAPDPNNRVHSVIEAGGKVKGIATQSGDGRGINAYYLNIKAKGGIEGTGNVGLAIQDSTVISCSDISGSGYGTGYGVTISAHSSNVQVKGDISGSVSRGDSWSPVHKIYIIQENESDGNSIAYDESSDIVGMDNVQARSFSSDYTFSCIERNTRYYGYCSRYYTSNPTYTPEWCQ